MEINKMLAELRSEREAIEQAILVLERIAAGRTRSRGRPPKWLSEIRQTNQTATPKRRTFSPETRARIAAAQRKRWVKVKRAKA